jgi:hypothetical protein
MTTITHHFVDGEEVDVTELTELQVSKMSAVAAPATGTSWLVLKSAAAAPAATDWRTTPFDQWDDSTLDAIESDSTITKEQERIVKSAVAKALHLDQKADKVNKATEKKVKAAAKRAATDALAKKGTDNTGGPGLGKPQHDVGATESAESAAILALVTDESAKELQAAKAGFLDPKQNAAVKQVMWSMLKKNANNGGDVQPAITRSIDASSIGEIAKAEADFNAAKTSMEKQDAANRLTHARLRFFHEFSQPQDLRKSFASDQQDATNAMVRETQAKIQANPQSATGGQSGGALLPQSAAPRVQTGSIPLMGSLSERLTPAGKREEEPKAQLQRINDELAQVQKDTKPGSITDRERELLQQKTHVQLAMTHA